MTTDNFIAFQEKFRVEELSIFKNNGWTLSLRPNQPTLGSCILSLNRPAESFADITPDEAAQLAKIVHWADSQLQAALGFDKINYLMLMMVDHHVHFHVIPRYAEATTCAGLTIEDANWPTPPDLGGVAVSDTQANEIIAAIKKA